MNMYIYMCVSPNSTTFCTLLTINATSDHATNYIMVKIYSCIYLFHGVELYSNHWNLIDQGLMQLLC